MKNTNSSFTSNLNHQPHSAPQVSPEPQLGKCGPKPVASPGIRTTARDYANPVDYRHPYPSMAQFADLLALRYDATASCGSSTNVLVVIHPRSPKPSCANTSFSSKLKKHWKPKSIRQTLLLPQIKKTSSDLDKSIHQIVP